MKIPMNFQAGSQSSPSRRRFLKDSTTLAVSGALAPYILSKPALFAANSETLKVGLIGCGGRGTGAALQALNADKNAMLTAMGDIFDDRLQGSLRSLKNEEAIRSRITVNPDTSFIGLDSYKKVLESGVDVVLLATPPGFRPFHLKAAVEAGKHVFCEKPMATDAPGVRSVMESVRIAKQKKLALVAGFCWRYNAGERELMKRIHDGEIGARTGVEPHRPVRPVRRAELGLERARDPRQRTLGVATALRAGPGARAGHRIRLRLGRLDAHAHGAVRHEQRGVGRLVHLVDARAPPAAHARRVGHLVRSRSRVVVAARTARAQHGIDHPPHRRSLAIDRDADPRPRGAAAARGVARRALPRGRACLAPSGHAHPAP